MNALAAIESELAKAWSALHHAAAWLVGACLLAQKDVAALEAADPLVASAIKAGEAVAAAHGVPVAAVEVVAADVLAAAKLLAPSAAAPSA